jgi:hypothetical protein
MFLILSMILSEKSATFRDHVLAIGDEASRADLNARVAQQIFDIFYSSSQAAKSPKALSETMVANNNTIHMV